MAVQPTQNIKQAYSNINIKWGNVGKDIEI